jgi:hypothetical protein
MQPVEIARGAMGPVKYYESIQMLRRLVVQCINMYENIYRCSRFVGVNFAWIYCILHVQTELLHPRTPDALRRPDCDVCQAGSTISMDILEQIRG